VTAAVAVSVPTVAVILAVPFVTAATKPVALTVATAASLVDHVTVCPDTALPLPSCTVVEEARTLVPLV